jgi:hypothetical protein
MLLVISAVSGSCGILTDPLKSDFSLCLGTTLLGFPSLKLADWLSYFLSSAIFILLSLKLSGFSLFLVTRGLVALFPSFLNLFVLVKEPDARL